MAMKASIAPALVLFGQPALAEGRRYGSVALAGRAEVTKPAGHRLSVTRGNSGELGLQLNPPPPLDRAAAGGSIALRPVIDGDPGDAFDVPMTCPRMTACDTGGRRVEIWFGGTGLDAFTLDGSSAAVDGIRTVSRLSRPLRPRSVGSTSIRIETGSPWAAVSVDQ